MTFTEQSLVSVSGEQRSKHTADAQAALSGPAIDGSERLQHRTPVQMSCLSLSRLTSITEGFVISICRNTLTAEHTACLILADPFLKQKSIWPQPGGKIIW